jgi:hypothetical protein
MFLNEDGIREAAKAEAVTREKWSVRARSRPRVAA